MVANPVRFSASPVHYRHAPPLLGQHTDEILTQELGLDAAALAGLRHRGIIE
jgi:crotonobetainyl-CoA:carnitine CoA-transferase CaiB-like acyl-CoA transferase